MPQLMKEARETGVNEQGKRRPTLADKIAEDVRRDLEKLEQKRAVKQSKTDEGSPGDKT